MIRLKTLFLILVFVCFLFTGILNAQSLNRTFNPAVANVRGSISMVSERADGKLIVSGNFDVISGVRRSHIVVLNQDGTIDETFNAGNFSSNIPGQTPGVGHVIPQPDGKLIVSGYFTHVNGTAVNKIIRLNSNGSLDTSFNIGTGPNNNSYISSVKLLPNGKILVGGNFTSFNNQPFARLVRLNSDGSLDTAFTGIINGMYVDNFIVQTDGKIVAVGDIFSISNGQFQGIVRLNANGSVDFTFNPGSGGDNYIFALAQQADGKILLSGDFRNYNGVERLGLARINSNGSLDTTFNASALTSNSIGTRVLFLIQNNGQIIIGGTFDQVNGIARKRLARLNANGTLDESYVPVFDRFEDHDTYVSPVHLLSDQKILVTGNFLNINQSNFFGFARLNTDGTPDASFSVHGKNVGRIYALAAQSDGKILAGGYFCSVNGVFSFGISRINSDGSVDTGFNSGRGVLKENILLGGLRDGYVNTIAVQNDGKILLGGEFATYNDFSSYSVVRINSNGSYDPTFSGNTSNFVVYAVKIQPDNKILVAGDRGLTRRNSDGTADLGFTASNINGSVRDIAVQPDGKIIIGGNFTNINGVARNRVARLNADGSLDTSFNTSVGANLSVTSLGLKNDGKIVVAGSFTAFNGTPRMRIAQLNSDGSLDTAFDPGTGANSTVNKILIQEDGKILIAGFFTAFANVERKKFARLLPNGSLDTTFAANLNPFFPETTETNIYAMTQNGGKITLGGNFSKMNDYNVSSLAQLQTINAPFDFDGDSKTDIGIFRPSTGAWWTQNSSNNQVAALQFGEASDKLAPADYTGDGKTDIAFFRPSSGQWYVLRSEDYSFYGFQFGASGDIPAPADFDGDGKTDAAVFRPSTSAWYILRSTDGGVTAQAFGASEDQPVVADYDGDSKADIAIFRPSTSAWWILKSSNNSVFAVQFGQTGDKTVQGDYTGDGKADVAFFRPSNGTWYVLRSEDFSFYGFPFGNSTDVPTPGDYDGDGKMDAAVFRDSNASWYLLRSTSGFTGIAFGNTGDRPIPNSFVR